MNNELYYKSLEQQKVKKIKNSIKLLFKKDNVIYSKYYNKWLYYQELAKRKRINYND